MLAIWIALHALASVFWVGGMAFAYIVLRPSLAQTAPPERLAIWRRVFARFLPLVIVSILVMVLSGYVVTFGYYGGFGSVGVHVHVMQLTGWIMFLLFFHLYFSPWKRFRRALDAGEGEAAAAALGQIRTIVLINLVLGTLTVAVGSGGRFW